MRPVWEQTGEGRSEGLLRQPPASVMPFHREAFPGSDEHREPRVSQAVAVPLRDGLTEGRPRVYSRRIRAVRCSRSGQESRDGPL